MLRVFLAIVIGFSALSTTYETANAAEQNIRILDKTVQKYETIARTWEPAIRKAARFIFWTLATISLVFTFGYSFVRGMGLGEVFSELMRFIISIGFFAWLLEKGPGLAGSIIKSLRLLGQRASSDYVLELTPSYLVTFGFGLIMDTLEAFGEMNLGPAIITLVLSIVIAAIYGLIAAQMVLLLCSAQIMIYAGIIYLGFGGSRWTQDMVLNYFRSILGLAIQTFAFSLIVGIGQTMVREMITEASGVKPVTVSGWVTTTTINTKVMTINDACVILIFSLVLVVILKQLPSMLAGIVSGASVGSMNVGGAAGAMIAGAAGAAAAIASGGASMAAGAAGGALALASAHTKSAADMTAAAAALTGSDDGGGVGGESGGGGGSSSEGGGAAGGALKGGLSGIMNRGLSRAAGMASNLAVGAGQSIKANLQATTTGGKISASIDKMHEAAQAKRAADKASQEGNNPSTDAPAALTAASPGVGAATDSPPLAPATGQESEPQDYGEMGSLSGAGGSSIGDTMFGDMSYDKSKIGLPDDK